MTSSPQMIQVYQDEEGSVAKYAPLLPHQPLNDANPRWANKSSKRSRVRRFALAGGAFLTLYLLFCTWAAHKRNQIFDSYGGPPGAEFPHPRWPFPRHPHHPPPPRPHFKPDVLGCVAVPNPDEDDSLTSVELAVTIPKHHILVLEDHLIWGDVSVSKVAPDSDMAALSEKNLTVGVTVASRPKCPHHPPPESEVPLEDEDSEEKEKKFVLCALSFTPHHHKGKPHPDELPEDVDHPHHPHPHPPHHPHPLPFPPPPPHVTVAILPAHNETYPKLPGPHHPPPPPGAPPPPPPPGPPPHDGPGEGDEEDVEMPAMVGQPASVFSRAWRSTLSFLFPMLPIFSDSFSFPHHPPHGHPPPPPPFIVTELTVSVPKFVPVKYGFPLPPFRPFRRHWGH